MSSLHAFIVGAAAMGYLVAAAFFLRFRRETGDRLFAFFAIAFSFLALNATLGVLYPLDEASKPLLYLPRLAAFVLIAYAVIDKNRSGGGDLRS